MATKIYQTKNIKLLDNKEIELVPLKIKYLREFMEIFEQINDVKNDDDALMILSKCAQIAMKQYYPKISKSLKQTEDALDIQMLYDLLDIAAGIKINKTKEDTVKDQAVESGASFSDLDLAKLEAEVFLLGIWKDYKELEMSMSMPELLATLEISRELDYTEKKFLAAMQGVNLDEHSESGEEKGQIEWEKMKARVFSRGATNDPNDVLSLQGPKAMDAGFGIGFGLDYSDERDPNIINNA